MRRFRSNKRRTVYRRKSHARKMTEMGLTLVILLSLAILVGRFDNPDTHTYSGDAIINDGDTITLKGERIRLQGIDAPEYDQLCSDAQGNQYACGRRSRQELVRLIGKSQVRCEGWERDKYGRMLAHCFAGDDNVSLNAQLVSLGWAVAYGGFEAEQRQARAGTQGLWEGQFERPRDFRVSKGDMIDNQHGGLGTLWNWLRSAFGSG